MPMKYRNLGKTGLKVSEIGAGCWAIGGPFTNLGVDGGWSDVSDENAKAGLMQAVDMGVNLFDTADVYGLGKSERLVGWMLRESKNRNIDREAFVVVSKTGLFQGCASHGYDPLQMKHQLEMSMQNLGVDYIDIYFLHHLDFGKNNEYLECAAATIREFKRKRKIRFVGLRGPHHFSFYRNSGGDFDADYNRFIKLAALVEPDVITIRYNVLSQSYNRPDTDIFAWAKQHNIGILIYKPLAQGLLIRRYSSKCPPKFTPGDNRRRKSWFKAKGLQAIEKRLDLIAQKYSLNTTRDYVHLFIKYCLARDANACVLVGFENRDQVAESFCIQGKLSVADVKFLETAFYGISDEIGDFAHLYFKDKT